MNFQLMVAVSRLRNLNQLINLLRVVSTLEIHYMLICRCNSILFYINCSSGCVSHNMYILAVLENYFSGIIGLHGFELFEENITLDGHHTKPSW